MPKSQIHSCPFSFMPKENTSGMDGMNEIFMSYPHLAIHAGDSGHDWAWMGMDEKLTKPSKGLFFHWCDDDGAIENQGCLLSIGENGSGTAQLFEWFFGEPSRVIEVSPEYLRACVFYTSAKAMNAAYERYLEAGHD